MNCSPCTLRWFSRLPSHRCTWPSMMKISCPSFVLYIPWAPLMSAVRRRRPDLRGTAAWFYSYRDGSFILLVSERVFHVAEQHDSVVVHHHHAPVMRRCTNLEEMRRHLPTELLADLVHFEFDLALAVNTDHRRQVGDLNARLF